MSTRMLSLVLPVLAAALLAGCGLPPATARVQVSPDIAAHKFQTVAVLPFESAPGEQQENGGVYWITRFPNNGDLISDMMATELISLGGFSLIERSQIQKILEEKGLSMSDVLRHKTPTEIGQMLSADAVVLGSVSKMECGANALNLRWSFVTFSVRMVHAPTGVVLWSAVVSRQEGTDRVQEIAGQECKQIAAELRDKLRAK